MADRARITSVEALKAFRSSLIIYVTKARPALEEVGADVLRTRIWLQTEARTRWETEIRKRTRKLVDAQQALFGARLSSLRDVTTSEQLTVRKAKEALAEAEEKLRMVKLWDRQFDNMVGPMERQLAKLQSVLTIEMAKAIAYLGAAAETLDAYTEISVPTGDASATGVPAETATVTEPAGGEKS